MIALLIPLVTLSIAGSGPVLYPGVVPVLLAGLLLVLLLLLLFVVDGMLFLIELCHRHHNG